MPPEDLEAIEHKASIAVWELASPLVIGRQANLKVGVKCSAGCQLTDQQIEIHDGAGEAIARAGLGATPWPGTSGLYWTDIEFPVPPEAGTHTFSVTCEHGRAVDHGVGLVCVMPMLANMDGFRRSNEQLGGVRRRIDM